MVYKRDMNPLLLPVFAVIILFNSCTSLQEKQKTDGLPVRSTKTEIPQKADSSPASHENLLREKGSEIIQGITPMAADIELMDRREKIGQLFMVEVRDPRNGKLLTKIDDSFREWAADLQPGGYILFADNLVNPEQTMKLITDLKALTTVPPFVALDEEGGVVSRLNAVPGMKGVPVPAARVIGSSGHVTQAQWAGRTIARQLKDLGFSVNFAPVADIHIPGSGGAIGERSYGTEPQIVSEMAVAFSRALEAEGILSVAKHFPGHGAAYGDSHTEKTVLDASLNLLIQRELVPFTSLIGQGIGGIMTGHIIVPSLDSTEKPASLSMNINDTLLRNYMNYKGLIFTDSLRMGGVTAFYNTAELPLLAFEAGADILLMPVSPTESRQILLKALESGRIPEQRLDDSLKRIAAAKQKFLARKNKTSAP
jgi:beta-N-acetylhexosaminidase